MKTHVKERLQEILTADEILQFNMLLNKDVEMVGQYPMWQVIPE
jgi:hypothetical protein